MRLEHRLSEIQACLGLYVEDVAGYIARVVADKFGVPMGGALTLDDLSEQPNARVDSQGDLVERPSDLEQLVMTLWARVQVHRREAGQSLHTMRTKAGVPCSCSECLRLKRHPAVACNQPF